MNSPTNRFLTSVVIAAGAACLALTACSKEDRSDASAKTKEAYADTKAAVSDAWADVKSFTFDKRDDFTKHMKALDAKLDAQLSEARANYSEDKASASRKAAMAELKDSEANYREKASALGNATAATWDSGKQNVIAAWDRLQAAYYKARAN